MTEFTKMDQDEYREMKKQERNEVFEMLSESTQSLMDSAEMIRYLDLQARLFDQTISNTLLIKAQMPEASWIRTSSEWGQDNISPLKGQKALKTLSSHSYRKEDNSLGTSYDVTKVFDVSQTTAAERKIWTYKYHDAQESILHRLPCALEMTPTVPDGTDAFYDRHQEVIFVKEGMSKDETFVALARELSCYELMRMDYSKSREDVLPYGECAAYLLAKRYGIDAPAPNVDKLIERFEGKEEKQVRKELADMKQSAAIIDVKVKEHQRMAREDKESER